MKGMGWELGMELNCTYITSIFSISLIVNKLLELMTCL
jgi:hypothetical protein